MPDPFGDAYTMSGETENKLAQRRVLFLGDAQQYPFVGDTATPDKEYPAELVMVLPNGSADGLAGALAQAQCWLAPILVFGDRNHDRADFYAQELSAASLEAGLNHIEAIEQAIARLPDHQGSSDKWLLAILSLSDTRNTDIQAHWNFAASTTIHYPLLTGIEEPVALLGNLADLGLLDRHPFERMHQCAHCRSSRLHVREECPNCHSGQLELSSLVHHYTCGTLAPEKEFLQHRAMVCPKCQKELRHYGVDYDRPDDHHVCKACGETTPDPEVGFVCIDCGQHTPGDAIQTIDRFHYALNSDGIQALNTGILPNTAITSFVRTLHTYYTVREFQALSQHQFKVANRYERAISGGLITIENLEALREELGSHTLSKSFLLFSEIISQNLRETDLLTSKDRDIYLVLPETPVEHTEALMARLETQVNNALSTPIQFSMQPYGIDSLQALLETLH